ncbi:MAG: hypothetical protein EXQ53_13300 [Acidobacteria bacterium]|nr:hypothetical protein [Acidobacteriota bacterium]
MVIETTAACNLRCAHRSHAVMARVKGHMAMPLYRRIIDEIAERAPGTEVWPTFYGEAFILDYRLFHMIQYAKTRGLTNLVRNTNGTRFTAEVAEWVMESGLDLLMFSLDGFTAPVFESVRVGANRAAVYANVERILELKARRGADVKIREKLSWGNTVTAGNLDPQMHRIACPWALRTCAIHWNGDVVACAVDYEGRFVAGNLREQSIHDIWTGSHRALQQQHLAHAFAALPSPCLDCLDGRSPAVPSITRRTRYDDRGDGVEAPGRRGGDERSVRAVATRVFRRSQSDHRVSHLLHAAVRQAGGPGARVAADRRRVLDRRGHRLADRVWRGRDCAGGRQRAAGRAVGRPGPQPGRSRSACAVSDSAGFCSSQHVRASLTGVRDA